jgi:sulfane dehydrogenase subunit SoxC
MAKTVIRKLFLSGTLVGATDFGSAPLGVPRSMLRPGDTIPAYGTPSRFEANVVRRPHGLPSPALTPLERQPGIITASGLTFVRTHAGVPRIDPARHRLLVHGRVRKPLFFSLDDLLRFPATTRIAFLECAGNSAPGWRALGSGVQFSHGLLSCAEWTGVPLRTLLDEAGASDPRWVVAEGADGAAYERSIPLPADDAEALVVYGQNGEMLRPEQGYPLRLLLPGAEGSANVKWLHRIKVVDGPLFAREETVRYGRTNADGSARLFDFTMGVKSVVTEPSPGRRFPARGFAELRGFAWSGAGRIASVDVTLDGGATWHAATLGQPVLSKALVRFTLPVTWTGSERIVASRATDDRGGVQPTMAALRETNGGDLRYHVNAIHAWRVRGDGSVESLDA